MTLLDLYRNPEIEPERVPAPNHGPDRRCAATGTRLSIAEAQVRARDIRHRLRNPANAVKDAGIDLSRHRPPKIDRRKPWHRPIIILVCNYISFNHVIQIVAKHFCISVTDILSSNRRAHIVRARHVAMYLSRHIIKASFPRIALAFDRDHASVFLGCRKIEKLRKADRQFDDELDLLIEMVRA